MKIKKFSVEGLELLEKNVSHFTGTGSRVYVPKSWERVVLVRVK